jgi:hypothetical protein
MAKRVEVHTDGHYLNGFDITSGLVKREKKTLVSSPSGEIPKSTNYRYLDAQKYRCTTDEQD